MESHGIGKSTLILQLCNKVAKENPEKTVLYVSGEESAQQVKLRADRLEIPSENIMFLGETDIDAIETILSELETVEQKEKFYKKLSEDNKYYVLELEKKNKQIVYMANFINDNTPYTRDTKEL